MRLIPPAYVKPYVKRQKNDATALFLRCYLARLELFDLEVVPVNQFPHFV